jgi:MscS family membrane protein
MTEWLHNEFLGITIGRYATALGIILVAFIAKKIFAFFFIRAIVPLASKTKHELDDLFLACLRKPLEFLIFLAGLFVAVEFLRLPVEPFDLDKFAAALLKALFIINLAWFFFNLVDMVDHYLGKWAARTETSLDDHLAPLVRKTLRIFIIIMAGLMAIQSFGYPVTGVLASLGIGGLAFALAAKDTVSNIFGSLMIIFDRPFQIGDWIKAGDMEGTVEEIGFRSTKIRTFAKTLISVPNNVIANMALDNFSRMPKRRIRLTVGVTYDTSPAQMREAVGQIRELLKTHPAIDQEFFLVNFTDFGASSLDIMVYCFTTTTVWSEYLDAREDVCLKIMDTLEALGLEIAFPSTTVYLRKEDQEQAAA